VVTIGDKVDNQVWRWFVYFIQTFSSTIKILLCVVAAADDGGAFQLCVHQLYILYILDIWLLTTHSLF
jgi:hypothetical protein